MTEAHYPERSKAKTVFTLGIIGFVIPPLALFAWNYGLEGLRAQRHQRRDPRNRGTAETGTVMGIVATVLWALLLLAVGMSSGI
jgi:hypothetical protein